MKLEELLGAELYAQVQAKLDEVNSKQTDKQKHVRYADLSEGEYVNKSKHAELQTKFDSQAEELVEANNLIADLKKSTEGNADLQTKITDYESNISELQAELEKTKIDSAIKVALLSEKALDVDYLTYKFKEKGELKLDDNGNIKGMEDLLAGLKIQFPTQFEAASQKKIEVNKLPDGDGDSNKPAETLADALAQVYEKRD